MIKKITLYLFFVSLAPICYTQQMEPSFDEQFETFRSLGFELNPGVEISDIKMWDEQDYLDNPFSLMYETFGIYLEREPWSPLSNRCWDFDTEAIYGNNSYKSILENLERITRGALKFTNIRDLVDFENNIAWISFEFEGKEYKWELEIQDDWVDITFFSKIVNLTNKYISNERFTYYDTGGQNFIIGYESSESLKLLRDKTSLNIIWLE